MFEIECQCAGGALSPGIAGCMPVVGRDVFPIFVDYEDSTGAVNTIPAGTVLNQTWLLAKLGNTDLSKRFYIAPKMENLVAAGSEAETETIGNINFQTGEEIKQAFTYEHVGTNGNPAIKAFYDSIKCRDLGVFFITRFGQINGMNDGNGNLAPIKLQQSSISAQYVQPTQGVVQKIMVTMQIDELENDANRDFISSEAIEYPTKNWFSNQPLQIIPTEISNSGQDTIVFRLNGLFGGVDFKKPITGIVAADLSPDNGVTTANVYNVTTASNVVTALVASPTAGLYTATLSAAQTAADIIKVDIFKAGYLMNSLYVTLV